MKKIFSLLLCMILLLCGCSDSNENQAEKVDISFQKIAACNNRTKLLEKYRYISERTASRSDEDDDFSYWVMYFEKNGENINAILDYSVDYKCYYYNNEVYTEYGDGNIRKVIQYRENYEKIISGLLARTDTLSYVFITNSNAEETENGYAAEFDFIVNNDILSELEGLGVEVGNKVRVKYELDKDLIIKKCKYYRVEEEKNTEVARIDVTYGEKRNFPDNVKNMENGEFVDINIIEDFGTGSQYSETFKVKNNSYISENDVLLTYYLFKDPYYQMSFDTFTEKVDKNTDIFIINSSYADILANQKAYMEKKLAEQTAADE